MNARDRLAPQMVEYDRISRRVDWRPYVMFFHPPNYSSQVLNTDGLGFRLSTDTNGAEVRVDTLGQRPCMLVSGNSVAFGVGASSDCTTVPSLLSLHSGGACVNFGGRAFSFMQELMMFMCYRHLLPSVERVVLFTGLNDMYLFYAPKLFDDNFGVFFFSDHYYKSLSSKPQTLTGRRKLAKCLLAPFMGESLDYAGASRAAFARAAVSLIGQRLRHPKKENSTDSWEDKIARIRQQRISSRDQALEIIDRTLDHWSLLARALGIELVYALQPLLPWTGKEPTSEESSLLDYTDSLDSKWHTILRLILDQDHYDWYAPALSSLCASRSIPFIDLNAEFRERADPRQWLFVDRVHLTDAGSDLAARIIAEQIQTTTGDRS